MKKKILILGVGNLLFTDEGIGIQALKRLEEHYVFPSNVRLLDGGTLGTGLMDALMECDLVFVLDAVLGGGNAGDIYRLTGDGLRKSLAFRDSLHQTDLVDTLLFCEMLGRRPEAVIYGMEPKNYTDMGLELSDVCREKIPALCEHLLNELKEINVLHTTKA